MKRLPNCGDFIPSFSVKLTPTGMSKRLGHKRMEQEQILQNNGEKDKTSILAVVQER